MNKDEGRFTLSGAKGTHFEFVKSNDVRENPVSCDLFEFATMRSWHDLVSFVAEWGCLYYELIDAVSYYSMKRSTSDWIPPFKGNLVRELSHWDVAEALDWEEERRQDLIPVQFAQRTSHYHDCVELTGVWWGASLLFSQLLFLYGIAEGQLNASVVKKNFFFCEKSGARYFIYRPVEHGDLLQTVGIIPKWWTEDSFTLENEEFGFGDDPIWAERVSQDEVCIEELIKRSAKSLVKNLVDGFFFQYPAVYELDEKYRLRQSFSEGENRALIFKLFLAFAEFIQNHGEVGICPECGNPIDKSRSRGTARMYCSHSSCKVKASQKRKRFVQECRSSGESIEYAVVKLGEPYRGSIERWWSEGDS